MINAPQAVKDALNSGAFFYADIIALNLGDVYDTGSDTVFYYTTAGHDIRFESINYKSGGVLKETAQISRKAKSGSDTIDIILSATDSTLVNAVIARQYMNKPTTIRRVLLNSSGGVIGDFAIPVRQAYAIGHDIDGTSLDPEIVFTCDTTVGIFDENNAYYASEEFHKRIEPGDRMMRHAYAARKEQEADSEESDEAYTLPVVYGEQLVEPTHVMRTVHYREEEAWIGNKDNRWYHTTFALVVAVGETEEVDLTNILWDGKRLNLQGTPGDVHARGQWAAYVRDDTNNQLDARNDPKLAFIRKDMSGGELNWLNDMYGKGLTVIWIKREHKQHRENGYTGGIKGPTSFKVPVKGRKVYDPRDQATKYTANPALQLRDYVLDKRTGAGNLGLSINEQSFADAANYYDSLTRDGKEQLATITSHRAFDSSLSYSEVFDYFIAIGRMLISDYDGYYAIRVEKAEPVSIKFGESDLIGGMSVRGGQLSDRVNSQTLTIQVWQQAEGSTNRELVEYDCFYPQNTDAGDLIYEQWLKEDGGRPLAASNSIPEITDRAHGDYHCAVMARKARVIDSAVVDVPPIGWLLEPADVIAITDPTTGQVERQWRVDEVSEDQGQVTLDLVDYDVNVYSPDLEALPDPDETIPPEETDSVEAPINLNVKIYSEGDAPTPDQYNQGEATWAIPGSQDPTQISHFTVTVFEQSGAVSYKTIETELIHYLHDLRVGETYRVMVEAVGYEGMISPSVSIEFPVGSPGLPDIVDVETTPYSVTISPRFTKPPAAINDLRYRFYFNTLDDVDSAQEYAFSQRATKEGLNPGTTYYFWVRTWTPWGESTGLKSVQASTENVDLGVSGAITSDNGFYWLRLSSGSWHPNENDINLTGRFVGEGVDVQALANCALNAVTGEITVTPTPTSQIDINIAANGSTAPRIEFVHKDSNSKVSQIVQAIQNGEDGADGTVARFEFTNTLAWVQEPNGGTWLPTDPLTDGTFIFSRSGVESRQNILAALNVSTGTIRLTKIEDNPDITLTFHSNDTAAPSVTATHSSGSSISQSFTAIRGGDDGDEGQRGTMHRSVEVPSGAWSDAPEYTTALFPDGQVVVWDTVLQFNNAAEWTETRYWTGTQWSATDYVVDGDAIVHGTVRADQIAANAITAGKIAAGAVVTGTIEANIEIKTPLLSGGKLVAGKIDGGEISGNDVTVKSDLVVGQNSTYKTVIRGATNGATNLAIGAGVKGGDLNKTLFRVDHNGRVRSFKADGNGDPTGNPVMDLNPEAGTFDFNGTVTVENLVGVLGTTRDFKSTSNVSWEISAAGQWDEHILADLNIREQNFDRDVYVTISIPELRSSSANADNMKASYSYPRANDSQMVNATTTLSVVGEMKTEYQIYAGIGTSLESYGYNSQVNMNIFYPVDVITCLVRIPKSTGAGVLKVPIKVRLTCGTKAVFVATSNGRAREFKPAEFEVTATVAKLQDEADFNISSK